MPISVKESIASQGPWPHYFPNYPLLSSELLQPLCARPAGKGQYQRGRKLCSKTVWWTYNRSSSS